jgi:hypothetical protein
MLASRYRAGFLARETNVWCCWALYTWISGICRPARRGAFVVGYGGERDSGVKCTHYVPTTAAGLEMSGHSANTAFVSTESTTGLENAVFFPMGWVRLYHDRSSNSYTPLAVVSHACNVSLLSTTAPTGANLEVSWEESAVLSQPISTRLRDIMKHFLIGCRLLSV